LLSELQRWSLVTFFCLSSLITVALAWRTFQSRHKIYWAYSFGLMSAGGILWMLSNGLGLLSTSVTVYDFFNKLDYLGIEVCILGLLFFSIQWAQRWKHIPRLILIICAVAALAVQALIWTNDLHHWMWTTLPAPNGFISANGSLFVIHLLFSYLLGTASLVLLLRAFFVREGMFRVQAGILLIGVLVPVTISFGVDALGWDVIPMVDEAALSLIFAVLAIAFITLRYRALELLPIAANLVLENMRDGVIVIDQAGLVVFTNRAAEKLLKLEAAKIIGKPVLELLDSLSLDVRNKWPERETGFEVQSVEPPERFYQLYATPLKETGAEQAGEMLTLYDVSDRKLMEERLQHMAISDPLTGCFNRGHFMECAGRLFRQAQRYRRPLTVAMLDLDNFKRVNDLYGHASGDRVLKSVATACLANLRRSDVFARFGGDEFVVMMPETGEEEGRLVAERLCEAVRSQFLESGQLTASIGVVGMQPGDNLPMERLLDMADQAMYASKQAGHDRVTVWMD
jgi:diguanylate cyclase (GGDEF)-like protein/PAS domain S-box-containing protein